MDDPKKPSNKPVSPGSEENPETEVPVSSSGKDSGDEGAQKTSPSETNNSPDDIPGSENSPADSSGPEKTADGEEETRTGNPPGNNLDSDTEESEAGSEIIAGPYNDPYDPDNIYGESNDFYDEQEYAPEAEKMPEPPDDPHHGEKPDTGDRAGEEAAAAVAVKKSEKDSTDKKKKAPSKEDDDDDSLEDQELGGRMSFLDHLDELRKRIFHALISVIVTFVGAWVFREQIFGFLSAPIKEVVEQLVVLRPTEPFTVYLKVSFAAAIFFAIPYIMFQVWLFIAPGLYRKEKVYALPFLFASSVLFVLGGMFAYYIILPPALNFLLNDFGSEFKAMISAVEFYDFELIIIIGMGAIFQLPVVVAFLSMFGLVSPGFMWRNFKYAFLLITIIAAVVSPTTDPMNLFLWSGPMVILYTFSIGISWIFKRRRTKKEKNEDERWSR